MSATPKRGFSSVSNGFEGPPGKRPFNAPSYDVQPGLRGMGPIGTSAALQGVIAGGGIVPTGTMSDGGGDYRGSTRGVARVPLDRQSIPELPPLTQFVRGEVVFTLKRELNTVLSLSQLNCLLKVAHERRVQSLKRLGNELAIEIGGMKPDMITFDENGRTRRCDDRNLVNWLQTLHTPRDIMNHIFPMGLYNGSSTTVLKEVLVESPFAYDCTIITEYQGDSEIFLNQCNGILGQEVFLILYRDHPKPDGHPLRLGENYGPWQFKVVASDHTPSAFDVSTELAAVVDHAMRQKQPLESPEIMVNQAGFEDDEYLGAPRLWVNRSTPLFCSPTTHITDLRFECHSETNRLKATPIADVLPCYRIGVIQLQNEDSSYPLDHETLQKMQTDPTGNIQKQLARTLRMALKFDLVF